VVGDELRITNVGFGILSRVICLIIESEDVVGSHYRAPTRFEDGLKKVHAWFIENWGDIKRSAEF
jgi:UDP-glucose 4-epimerase